MITADFEKQSKMEYTIKALQNELERYKSGEEYQRIENRHKSELASLTRENRKLKKELEKAERDHKKTIKQMREAEDDMIHDFEKTINRKDREIAKLNQKILELQRKNDNCQEENRQLNGELKQAREELEKANGQFRKLQAQINRDYQNSGIPSSMCPNRGKITNCREKTGRKPGGQKGRTGACRPRFEPTKPPILLPPPDECLTNPDIVPTGEYITKDVVGIEMMITCTRYIAEIFKDTKTGKTFHAAFPGGIQNETNYNSSVKALAYILNTYGLSIDKTIEVISAITVGKLNLSKGMVNNLKEEFSHKTKEERDRIFADMLLAPVMNVDFTSCKVNGKNMQVIVCNADEVPLYFAREHKGDEGVKGTPLENFTGIVVHDADPTYSHYGSAHQQCLAHVLRYLKDSIGNEPDRTWNTDMREVIQEMIAYRKSIPDGGLPDPEKVAELERRYDEAIEKGKQEYEAVPPSAYYRNGYNLWKRMSERRAEHLLFLYDMRVPYTNSICERNLRITKRKAHQTMGFRSKDSVGQLCDTLSIIGVCKKNGDNVYTRMVNIFDR